jgi:hypothetical protein
MEALGRKTLFCSKQMGRRITMKNVKKIAVLLLALGVTTGLTVAADKPEETKGKPDASIQLSSGSFAAGIGFSWGSGTLTYKGKEHPISVKGLSLGKVGITKATAAGEVYNLKKLTDFDGNYTSAGTGLTLAGGRSAIAMKNQNGVEVVVASTTRGADVTLGGAGVEMRIKK